MREEARCHLKQVMIIIVCFSLLFTALPSFSASQQELYKGGVGAYSEGFYQVAEAQFREFLQSYPQHIQAQGVRYLLGKALYEQKKFADAKKEFIDLLNAQKKFQATDAAYFWLGLSCEKLGDLPSAQNNFLAVVTRYPQSAWYPSSLFLLGKISFQEGRYAKAETHLRRTIQIRTVSRSLSCTAKFWLGLALYEQGKYKETENLLQEVIDSKLQEELLEEALYWLGQTYIKLKKYKKGAIVFRSLLKRFPQSALFSHALYGESLCLYLNDRKDEALQTLLTLKNSFPHTPLLANVLLFMGELYIELDKNQEAIVVLKEFLNRFAQDNRLKGKILLSLGWCYLRLGDVLQVKEISYQIVKLSPDERNKALAQYILADLNTYDGNCQEAMPYWFNLLNTIEYRQEVLFKIALCSFLEKKYKESLVNIDLLQFEYPNFYRMHEALWIQGESLREQGDISEARKSFSTVVREHKKSLWYPWSIFRLIAIFLDEDIQESENFFDMIRKKYPAHELVYEAALKLGIKKAERFEYESSLYYLSIAAHSLNRSVVNDALCCQGEIYFNLKDYQKALNAYQTVVAENPLPAGTLAAVAFLEIGNINYLMNDQNRAKEAYKKAIEFSPDEYFKIKVKTFLKALERGGT